MMERKERPDIARLVSIYSLAHQQTGKPRYQQVIEQTLAFIERELTAPKGGFYSLLDSDSEEGKYYLWTIVELQKVLRVDSPFGGGVLQGHRRWELGERPKHSLIDPPTQQTLLPSTGFRRRRWQTVSPLPDRSC